MAKRKLATKRLVVAAVSIYAIVWLLGLAFYWISRATGTLGGGMIMGYVTLVLYVALPLASLVSSALIGRAGDLAWWRLLVPLVSAVLYWLFTVATFALSTACGLTNIASADAFALVFGLVFSAIGLAVGWAFEGFRKSRCAE